jgi:uncharacterized repeat protein (TIGR02543 family)
MGAPSSTAWDRIVNGSSDGRKGRLGIYTSVSNTANKTTVNVQVWFWTIYSCTDNNNIFYYDAGTSVSSATTSQGSKLIDHNVNSGGGWSTSNQTELINKTYTYDRGKSAVTYKVYAKLANIDMLNGAVSVNASYTVPALDSYTVSYNGNGADSGVPGSQTKYYGINLTLSSTKPVRNGYSFKGWALSKADADDNKWYYQPGGTCGKNENLTLYAVWEPNKYTVSYNANGGSDAPGNQTKTHGVNLPLSSDKPTRPNYKFLGWSKSASSTTVAYNAGAIYTPNADITLYAVWELAYTKPRITEYQVTRCDGSGNDSDEGTFAHVRFTYTCDQALSSIVVECISATAEPYSKPISVTGNSSGVDVIIGGSLSSESTYTVRVIVTDANGYNSVSTTLNGMIFPMDFLAGGKGVSFGKPAELEGYVDFGFNAHFTNQLRICGRDLEGNIKEAFQPVNENGNTVIGWSNYNMKRGNTNLYGYDVNFGVSNIANPDTYRPYRRQGDSLTITLRTSGFVTDAGTEVHFFIPFAVPIIGNPTVTITSGNGFILRQGSKYTHGSTATTYAFPTSYEVQTRHMFNGINVKAIFADTTDVTNNDAIGIHWNGTITFT